jgi:hypothetical protein
VDAIFDEAVKRWTNQALDAGMRFLALEEEHTTRLEEIGFRRATLSKAIYPKLPADVSTVDFSGWPIFTHARVSDDIVRSFCVALDNRKDRIPWQGEGPFPWNGCAKTARRDRWMFRFIPRQRSFGASEVT